MSNFSYIFTKNPNGQTQALLCYNGKTRTLVDSEDEFQSLKSILTSGAAKDELTELIYEAFFSPSAENRGRLVGHVTKEAVRVDANGVYFWGEKVWGRLSDQILGLTLQGLPVDNLVLFLQKVMENPSKSSRDQLYTFLELNSLTIDQDGFLIGYKSITPEGTSHASGTAFVNGVEHNGRIPQKVGDRVTMPRYTVVEDPNAACSTGLHIGAWEYIRSSYPNCPVLTVRVHPKDVVSVPRDSSFQKIRVCEYAILDQTNYRAFEPSSKLTVDQYPSAAVVKPAKNFWRYFLGEDFENSVDWGDFTGALRKLIDGLNITSHLSIIASKELEDLLGERPYTEDLYSLLAGARRYHYVRTVVKLLDKLNELHENHFYN